MAIVKEMKINGAVIRVHDDSLVSEEEKRKILKRMSDRANDYLIRKYLSELNNKE